MHYQAAVLSSARTAAEAVFLGSYPPRECGIATFTKDLVDAYQRFSSVTPSVVAIEEPGAPARPYDERVWSHLIQDDRTSYRAAARAIDQHPSDVLCVQHEYGLFGGDQGAWVLDLLDAVRKPVAVSLHTVLPDPTPSHRDVARRLVDRADAIVTLSATGRSILTDRYGADPAKLHVIHHGVPDVPFRSTDEAKRALGLENRLTISTFGLISRGKGLEYAIEAMREVAKLHPTALYLILGQTHPSVRRHEGETYRASLQATIAEYGLENNVVLVDRYLAFDELLQYLSATDIYLTPYINPDQIVSGTLAYAVGCGKAIVSTPYLYARELLANGRGFLAEFRDAGSIAARAIALLDDPLLRRATERRAYRFGRLMTWPHVAAAYASLFGGLVANGSASPDLSLPA